jgi:hypothetical protein
MGQQKITCEAYGCFASAEEEINVPVGQTGEIYLSVCRNCRSKFVHHDFDVNQEKIRFRKIANSGSMVARRDQSIASQYNPRKGAGPE